MRVSFDLTREDYFTFNMYHYAQSPTLRRQKWKGLMWITLIVIMVWLFLLSNDKPEETRHLWAFLIPLPLGWIIYPHYLRRAVRINIGRMMDEGQNRTVLGKKEVTITPVEITASGDLISTTVRWKAVERIEVTDLYAYLYFGALTAVIIPRRAFSTDADFKAWVESARKYRDAASA